MEPIDMDLVRQDLEMRRWAYTEAARMAGEGADMSDVLQDAENLFQWFTTGALP